MKKLLLITFIIYSSASFGQSRVHNKANVLKRIGSIAYDGSEILPLKLINPTVVANPAKLSATQTIIGNTYYDLQTNASTDDRLVRYGNNEVSATWTLGMQYTAFPDRGTGYNYFDGNSWLPAPTARIEPATSGYRTGWPSIAVTSSGKEHNYAHTVVDDSSVYSHRPVAGSGSWTYEFFPGVSPTQYTFWPRMTAGGSNGNSLHHIVITAPVANGGTTYMGIDGALLYSRSQDEGVTWDKVFEMLPGVDSTTYRSMGADAYAIHSRGDIVAIVTGSYFNDWALWKSTDNGNTWTQTIIHDFPFTAYELSDAGTITDIDLDGIGDLVPTTDGKVAVLIDHLGTVHAWAGALEVMDDDSSAGQTTFSWQPYYDALLYWNESMGAGTPPDTIAWTVDLNSDGTFNFATDSIPFYRGSMTSQPSAGIDANGNIYVAYMSPVEGTSSGSTGPGVANDFNYRNVYLIASTDGGSTWKTPFNVTNDDFTEGVYPVIPKDVRTDCVDIIWQQDGRPDIAAVPAAGNPLHPFDASNINYIVHDCVPTQLLVSVSENQLPNIPEIAVYPNPATEVVTINYSIKETTDIIVQLTNTMGQIIFTELHKSLTPGDHTLNLNIGSLPAGIYFINSLAGNQINSAKIIKK